jgi:hypothetical protein
MSNSDILYSLTLSPSSVLASEVTLSSQIVHPLSTVCWFDFLTLPPHCVSDLLPVPARPESCGCTVDSKLRPERPHVGRW